MKGVFGNEGALLLFLVETNCRFSARVDSERIESRLWRSVAPRSQTAATVGLASMAVGVILALALMRAPLPPEIKEPGQQGPFRNIGLLIMTSAAAVVVAFLIWSGGWIPNAPSRTAYPIRGIDVSHHQAQINWSRIDPKEIQFAYIKATEGADFKDTKFGDNWDGAEAAGLRRGAYHFFTLGTSGAQQANNFIATVPIDLMALPPAIDLEMSGYNRGRTQPVPDFQRELTAFMKAVTKEYGKVPVIYTTKDFRRQFLSDYRVDRLWIREVVLWPREGWTFWQFSARARLHGISTAVDLNTFAGDVADFETFINHRAGAVEDEEKPPPPRRRKKKK